MRKRIIFLHPDLGIGGAERAIIDAAVALKEQNHDVLMITNYHNKAHCFQETIDGTIDVQVIGAWIPRQLFGYFHALLAYLKMFIAACYIICFHRSQCDLVFVDQVSLPLVILHLFNLKCLFYCHFPDKLLVTSKQSLIKKIYRSFIDKSEEFSLQFADRILVNSYFTASIFKSSFKSLKHINPDVLYPVPNIKTSSLNSKSASVLHEYGVNVPASIIFLSINRYEKKKGIKCALESMSHLFKNWSRFIDKSVQVTKEDVFMIHVGGYDPRVIENVEHFQELSTLAEVVDIKDNFLLLKSCPFDLKCALIQECTVLIYTPENEHFGIVPVEAMGMSTPVIALNSGGPKETVLSGETGFLCEGSPGTTELHECMAKSMAKFINDPKLSATMGAKGKRRVEKDFSFKVFKQNLNRYVKATMAGS